MDRVLVTSRLFICYLKNEFNIDERMIEYLPQYAEDLFEELPIRENDGISNFVFAGNIGNMQSVETILHAAERLISEPVRFHIVGSGSDLERLLKLAKDKKIENVIFYGRKPLTDMPSYYRKADAMLVTLKKDHVLSFTLPGKIQSYMAAGKPIIGAIDGETAVIIQNSKCGLVGCAENSEELAKNILKFIHLNRSEKETLGKNARAFYQQNFAEKAFMNKLEYELSNFCSK